MHFVQTVLGILEGFRITAIVTVLGLAFAIPFALVFGVLQHFARGWQWWITTAIIEFWRSSPVIVLLFAFYYSLPAFGVILPAIAVGSMVLGLNIGGYGSQSVRAALQALDKGQVDAGRALGFRRLQILVLIELPQALVATFPTFINLGIQLIKGTALVSLITLTDMTFRAKQLSQLQFDPVGIYSALIVAYLLVCYPVTIFGQRMEGAFRAGQGQAQ